MPSSNGYEQIKKHEGFTPKLKVDRTEKGKKLNNSVIGYGYNVNSANDPVDDLVQSGVLKEDVQAVLKGDKEITQGQADTLFDISVRRAAQDANAAISNFARLEKPVQDVLINMSYQMGRDGLRNFKRMRTALLNEDYGSAAREILNSKFAKEQTPNRAEDLAKSLMEYESQRKDAQAEKPQVKSPIDYYKSNLAAKLSSLYNKQTLTDRLAKGISTMVKQQQEQPKEDSE